VLRYRLFDVEIIVNRSLVYGVLSAAAILIYASAVTLITRLAGGEAPAGPLIASAAAALAIQPLRSRVHRTVTGLLYGSRDDPAKLVGQLGSSLEQSDSNAAIPDVVAATLARALRLSYAQLELRRPDGEPL